MNQPYEVQTPGSGEKGFSLQPTGYLLSRFGLLALVILLVLAAWNGHVVIVILLGLALSAAGLSKLWSRLSLAGVSCQRFLDGTRAFPGEHIELRLRLANRKLLPLPWVQVDDEIPEKLAPPDTVTTPGTGPGTRLLSNTASLLWYSGINWRHHLYCRKRGYYPLGAITVTSGDIFGFYPRSARQSPGEQIIVYPALFPIARLALPSLHPVGESRAERHIFEDPTRTIGVRDYSPHDSLRHIHWKASARHQSLQVKVFEPTTTLKVVLFLAVDSFQGDGISEDDFELGVSTAASVANFVVQRRSQVGLFANSLLPDSARPIRIFPGGGLNQLITILEALAKVVPASSSSSTEFLQEEWGHLPWGTTAMLIISRPPENLPVLLVRMKEAGYKLAVLQIGEQGMPGAGYTDAWYRVTVSGGSIKFEPLRAE